jgi:hypothetical protein
MTLRELIWVSVIASGGAVAGVTCGLRWRIGAGHRWGFEALIVCAIFGALGSILIVSGLHLLDELGRYLQRKYRDRRR